jgi:hypothetical protein
MAETSVSADKPSPWSFLRAFSYHWSDYMTGAPSIFLVLVGVLLPLVGYQDKTTVTIISVGTGLTGILCGVFAAYRVWQRERQAVLTTQQKIVELIDRLTPKFRVYYDQEKEGMVDAVNKSISHTTISALGTPIHHEKQTHSKYFRLWLDATEPATVTNCEVYLIALEFRPSPDQAFVHIPVPQPLPLTKEKFDVKPGLRRPVDFLMSDEEGYFGHSPDVYWPFAMDDAINISGTYRFTFVAHGGGVTAPPIRVDVTWNGHWDKVCAREVTDSA